METLQDTGVPGALTGTKRGSTKERMAIPMYNAGRLLRFGAASLSAAVMDVGIFILLTATLFSDTAGGIFAATAVARAVSGIYNFLVNRSLVFRVEQATGRQFAGYLALFILQMALSAVLVWLLGFLPLTLRIRKPLADAALFLFSYHIQRRLIFQIQNQPREE